MVRKTGNAKSRFRMFVNSVYEAKPRLPLVHTTDTYKFVDALNAGSIDPRPCKVFEGESLIYLFYGRPSFRANADAQPTEMAHYLPVCFLFAPEKCGEIRRIFPFDSGAFDKGLYASFMHEQMLLDDFGLEPDVKTLGKMVSRFFGSVTNYMDGNAIASLTADPSQFEAQSYSKLASAKGANSIDNRGSSVEVQLENSIVIRDAVMAIILPSIFVDSEAGMQLKSLGIDVIPYKAYDRLKPSEYVSTIFELCEQYYTNLNLISGKGA